jgi:hypothetical protein
MSRQHYRYFVIPLASVPQNPTYRVWYSTWLPERSEYVWSERRPVDTSNETTTWVVGATDGADVPPDATVIIQNSVKCPPPPPLALPFDATSAEVQTALTQALVDIRSL